MQDLRTGELKALDLKFFEGMEQLTGRQQRDQPDVGKKKHVVGR